MNNPEQSQNIPNQSARRRSSGFMPAFEGLSQHRQNANNAARRQSMSDQQSKPGIFGQFFHNTLGRNAK
ncbi:hypothetical protein Trco_002099 [Trichoderma cornu-damae]|uniref:Conidiation-specific expression protein n=1 Tax=Trichoderma cornu-damae TaxID=654480 RepID=A0A9P8TXP6_9HYPO|nr:hypothetical protein Trco_002099 [Trichoderma cornu-damae]